jgi:tRNA-binding EMAP/Myf-like protein
MLMSLNDAYVTEVAEGAEALDVTKLDIRVGKIISIEQHPDADR